MRRPGTRSRHLESARGFTLPELLMAIAIFSMITAMSAVGFSSATRAMKGTAGMQQVTAQLRMARDMAISERRSMEVQFLGTNEIRTVRREIPNGTTLINQYFLEGSVQWHRFASVPDTPDGFGIAGANSFATQKPSRFLSDGRWVDDAGAALSGNICLGIPGQPVSQRAVTIFGGTGRMRGYTWNGTEWLE